MRSLYTLALYLLAPLIPLRLLWRARKQPEYLQHWGERFGFYAAQPHRPLIWIHAVSVGETRAAAPLIAALEKRYPDSDILLTHMTPTGRTTGLELYGERVHQAYLPYDYPGAVRRFLQYFQPRFGLLMETELWPNLIAACAANKVPLALINARLSERSARGYARFGGLVRDTLNKLPLICAQTEADAARVRGLGAETIEVTGNLKFDVTPPADWAQQASALRKLWGENRRVLLAASTRDGEEALLLDALPPQLALDILLVIVPRHPQRFDTVAKLLQERGVPFQHRSAQEPIHAETRVVLGDSMGEMAAYYGTADVAIIGGSLLPYGGQNLIEACALGVPVILGPHTYNFTQAAQEAVEHAAALRVQTAQEAIVGGMVLLQDETRRAAMGEAAQAFAQAHRGATGRTLDALQKQLGV